MIQRTKLNRTASSLIDNLSSVLLLEYMEQEGEYGAGFEFKLAGVTKGPFNLDTFNGCAEWEFNQMLSIRSGLSLTTGGLEEIALNVVQKF